MTDAERETVQLLREIAEERRTDRRRGLFLGALIAAVSISVAVGGMLLVGDSHTRAAPFFLAVVLATHYGSQFKCEKEAAWFAALGSVPIVLFLGIEKDAPVSWQIVNAATLAAIASLSHLICPPARPIYPAGFARPSRHLRPRRGLSPRAEMDNKLAPL
jgi:hypothetical protein